MNIDRADPADNTRLPARSRKAGRHLLLLGTVALGVLLCFAALWCETTDRDVAVAQSRKPVLITRIFTGPDGLAHAEDIELTLNARGVSEMFKATGAEFSVRQPTPGASPSNTAVHGCAGAGRRCRR